MDKETLLEHEPVKEEALTKRRKYEEPWIIEYIVEERNKQKSFDDITKGLKERGEESISQQEVIRLFKVAAAKTVTTKNTAKADFVDFTEQLRGIYGDVINLMGGYVRSLRSINEELEKIKIEDEEGKINILATQMSIAKQIPLATGLMKEVREYVKNQISLYDIVQETKEKSLSVSDVLEQTNEYFPIMLKENIKDIREELGNNITVDQLEKYLKKKLN
jgi:NAD+--asparagine ADP-ribosyltransferase